MEVEFSYCEKCGTINAVRLSSVGWLAKECKCLADFSKNDEYIPDEEFMKIWQ